MNTSLLRKGCRDGKSVYNVYGPMCMDWKRGYSLGGVQEESSSCNTRHRTCVLLVEARIDPFGTPLGTPALPTLLLHGQ